MTTDNPVDLSFDNVSDIDLPPTAGIRELRFDEAPTLEQKPISSKNPELVPTVIIKPKLNDGGKGQFPADEQDRMVYGQFNMNDSRNRTLVKRMFLGAGIPVPEGSSFTMLAPQLVGKTVRADYKHSNGKRDDGSPVVYGNIRDFIVDASMLTNVPGKTPAVPTVSV